MASNVSTWKGWEAELLAPLGAPNTAKARTFLEEWAATEPHGCAHNPLGATIHAAGSTHCKHVAGKVYTQAYPTRKEGIAATVKQLREAPYKAIVACLHSGNPYTFTDWQEVVGELGTWGAHTFASEYAAAMQAPVSTGGGGAPATADGAMKAYHHLSKTLARGVPKGLHKVDKLNRATLARLHGRR